MSDRDRLAAALEKALRELDPSAWIDAYDADGCAWLAVDGVYSLGAIADALIAAGVTMPPSPPCGETTVILGIEYVCELPPHTADFPVHQCSDSVGVMVWRVRVDGCEVVAAWTHDGRKR